MDKRCEYKRMKQRDWIKELEAKKKKKREEKVLQYDKNGWYRWYVTGTASATTGDIVYYNTTGTGNVF